MFADSGDVCEQAADEDKPGGGRHWISGESLLHPAPEVIFFTFWCNISNFVLMPLLSMGETPHIIVLQKGDNSVTVVSGWNQYIY